MPNSTKKSQSQEERKKKSMTPNIYTVTLISSMYAINDDKIKCRGRLDLCTCLNFRANHHTGILLVTVIYTRSPESPKMGTLTTLILGFTSFVPTGSIRTRFLPEHSVFNQGNCETMGHEIRSWAGLERSPLSFYQIKTWWWKSWQTDDRLTMCRQLQNSQQPHI